MNDPAELGNVLEVLEGIQQEFNAGGSARKVSLADLIVLGGVAAIEKAATDAGHEMSVPFTPGRTDASQEMTDVESFAYMEPTANGFRNYGAPGSSVSPAMALIDKADTQKLTGPEMTVLVAGLRVLDANAGGVDHGVFTARPGTLSNDFFVNLLDIGVAWTKSADDESVFEGRDRTSGELKCTETPVDLVFGFNSELRALAELYAQEDMRERFVEVSWLLGIR